MSYPLQLSDIQKEACNFILTNWTLKTPLNSLCALDVGTGKTRIACYIIHTLLQSKQNKAYVLVCSPTEVLRDKNWKKELEDSKIKTCTLIGENFEMVKLPGGRLAIYPDTVALITYQKLCMKENISFFINSPPSCIIFDEYHTLTNNIQNENQFYRNAIKQLTVPKKLGLTATPYINHENEMIFVYGMLNNYNSIANYYNYMNIKDENKKKMLLEKSRQTVLSQNFIFQKADRKKIPLHSFLCCVPVNKLFKDACETLLSEYSSYKRRKKGMYQCNYLMISPTLLENPFFADARIRTTLSPSVLMVKAILKEIPPQDKVIIFDTTKNTLQYIKSQDFVEAYNPLIFYGEKKRCQKNFSFFNSNKKNRLLLATRAKGSEGNNLQIANHIIILNLWYTYKDIIQITGRVYRTGQCKPVYVYWVLPYYKPIESDAPKDLTDIQSMTNNNAAISLKKILEKKKKFENYVRLNQNHLMPVTKIFTNIDTLENDVEEWFAALRSKYPEVTNILENGAEEMNSTFMIQAQEEIESSIFSGRHDCDASTLITSKIILDREIAANSPPYDPYEGVEFTLD